MANGNIKPDHNGAKNGGGAWDTRANAKEMSNRVRREMDKVEVINGVEYRDGQPNLDQVGFPMDEFYDEDGELI